MPTIVIYPQPTNFPTVMPTDVPTSNKPSNKPSTISVEPSSKPSISMKPSSIPSNSLEPSTSNQPSSSSMPSSIPSASPSHEPTSDPSAAPSTAPIDAPSNVPSSERTNAPTNEGMLRRVVLRSGESLERGHYVISPSGIYRAGMNNQGDFILEYTNQSSNNGTSSLIWSAGSEGAKYCKMQGDGNLVCKNNSNDVLWKSESSKHDGSELVIDDAGRVALLLHNTYIWMDGLPQGEFTGPSSPDLVFPVRGSFYYSWYPNTWEISGIKAIFEPDLGYYNSGDPIVVKSHVDAMTYANINVMMISWWGPDTNLDKARITQLMDETLLQESPVKWSIYYEDEYANDYSINQVKADLAYLKKWFVWHKAWAYVNGKPLIFIWNESECEVTQRWMEATKGEWYVVTKLFSNYNDCPVQPDGWHQYGPAKAIQHHETYSFVISPGFWKADEKTARFPRLSKSEWCDNVQLMVDSNEPWQLITTFNEAGEGTIIEPSKENWPSKSGYGYYLDCLHDIKPAKISNDWYHGSTKTYDEDGNMTWEIPQGVKPGDLLLLFMSRTDDYLPLYLPGWNYAASCFKTHNDQDECYTKNDCVRMLNESYCQTFANGNGKDLATIVFYKIYQKYEPMVSKYEIIGIHPGWGFVLALNGIDTSNPIRGFSTASADNDSDSVFPSVYGKKDDILLLSMAFDDTAKKEDFLPPEGTDFINFVYGDDEAGFVYYKVLEKDGMSGKLESIGPGGSGNKDALISLVLRRQS